MPKLLSLFSGCGGLDTGFEHAGFQSALAFDIRQDSIASFNLNRPGRRAGHVADIRELTLKRLDELAGGCFAPVGVIGGPPCQSFSRANHRRSADDPRGTLVPTFARLVAELNARARVKFAVMENVPDLLDGDARPILDNAEQILRGAGFSTVSAILDAASFGVPQRRRRLFLVAMNVGAPGIEWKPPHGPIQTGAERTISQAIGHLPEPTYFDRTAGLQPAFHPNHWCMTPKSWRFSTPGALREGDSAKRSFKVLAWNKPSLAVSYGNREVHVHPRGHRRLSVYEAMLLQGFPADYLLLGSMSSQVTQVSEAVPPPLAEAVARSIRRQLRAAAENARARHGNRSGDRGHSHSRRPRVAAPFPA